MLSRCLRCRHKFGPPQLEYCHIVLMLKKFCRWPNTSIHYMILPPCFWDRTKFQSNVESNEPSLSFVEWMFSLSKRVKCRVSVAGVEIPFCHQRKVNEGKKNLFLGFCSLRNGARRRIYPSFFSVLDCWEWADFVSGKSHCHPMANAATEHFVVCPRHKRIHIFTSVIRLGIMTWRQFRSHEQRPGTLSRF